MAPIRQMFDRYVSDFQDDSGALPPLALLKLDHSRRVAADCLDIARSMNWCEDDLYLAEAAGLLHDIGRFDQLRRFGTFADHKSVNHGEHGHRIALDRKLLDAMHPTGRQAVLDCIRHHNCKTVPGCVTPDSLRFVNLVRDADKLDILFIISDTLRRKSYLSQPEILLQVDIDGPPSATIVREVLETRSVSYGQVRTLADFNLMRVAWVYDLNYDAACRRFRDRDLFQSARETLPDTPDVREIMHRAETYLDDRIRDSSVTGS